jgi:excisionase family DNA binding protein
MELSSWSGPGVLADAAGALASDSPYAITLDDSCLLPYSLCCGSPDTCPETSGADGRRESRMGRLLSTAEAAALLGLSRRTLEKWRYERRGPAYRALGSRRVRYDEDDLRAWVDSQPEGPLRPAAP